ncbi:MAG: S4 domain-containing protein, partial [Enterococcus faecium]
MTELKTTIYHESGRIDKVLTNLFSNYSRSQIQLWLKERAVSVNGEPVKA